MKRHGGVVPWAQPAQAVPDGAEVETATPARPASFASDLFVPLAQSLVTGGLTGGLFTLALAELVPGFDGDLLRVWAFSALAISTVAWLLLLAQTRRLLWQLERWTGKDLDGDGTTGKPAAVPQVLRVEVSNGTREVYLDLPGKPAALVTLARGVLAGRSFAEGSWSGRGGLFSRSEFRQDPGYPDRAGAGDLAQPRGQGPGGRDDGGRPGRLSPAGRVDGMNVRTRARARARGGTRFAMRGRYGKGRGVVDRNEKAV